MRLMQRSFTALKWNYLGAFARAGSQFLIGIVLARLLGPEPFGVVAVAWLVFGLGNLVADFGLASALIQRKEISTDEIRYVFTLQMLVGLLLTGIIASSAGWIAMFFRHPEAARVIQAMSLLFVFQSLGQTAIALLRRNLDFRRPQLAQFSSYLIGYICIGVPMAFAGYGAWSLVVANLVQSLLNSAIVYAAVRHPLWPRFRLKEHSLFSFGAKVTASNLSSWGLINLDSTLIGRVFGIAELGLYNRAINLVTTPITAIVPSLQSVLFAASARAQEDRPALRRTYLAALGVIGFVCMPPFFALAVVPETVMTGIYGLSWKNAAPLLTPLALAMPFNALLSIGGPMMMGLGQAGRELSVQGASLALFAMLLWWAASYSVEAVAWSSTAIYVLRFLLVTGVTLNLLEARWVELGKVLRGPLLVALFCVVTVYGLDFALKSLVLHPAVRLFFAVVTGAATFVVFFLLGQRWLVVQSISGLLKQVGPQLPPAMRWLFRA